MKLKQWAQSYQGLLQNTILPRLGRYELAELTPPRLKHFFCRSARRKGQKHL